MLADELDLTQTEIARRVGKSRPAVANTMRLLELPDDVLDLVADGALSEGHGRALLLAARPGRAIGAGPPAVKRGLSVRETEAAAKRAARQRRSEPSADGRRGWTTSSPTWPSTRPGSRWRCAPAVRRGPRGGRVEIRVRAGAELGRIVDQLRAERQRVACGRQLTLP